MRKNNFLLFISYALFGGIWGLYYLDLFGTFSFSDIPFAIAVLFALAFIRIQRSSSTVSFGISMMFLVLMGITFTAIGTGVRTERIGEWFYVFLLLGLIQYLWEVRRLPN